MVTLLLLAVAFSFSMYLVVFFNLGDVAKGWLMRHTLVFLAVEIGVTIPLMVSLFGPGLIAGIVNLSTSALFAIFLKLYEMGHKDIASYTMKQYVRDQIDAYRAVRKAKKISA